MEKFPKKRMRPKMRSFLSFRESLFLTKGEAEMVTSRMRKLPSEAKKSPEKAMRR